MALLALVSSYGQGHANHGPSLGGIEDSFLCFDASQADRILVGVQPLGVHDLFD